MNRIRRCEFAELMAAFARENAVKDARYGDKGDDWPRHRFEEANRHFNGEWYEYQFSQADLARIRLQWNSEFGIPPQGMMVRDALKLPAFGQWLAQGKDRAFPQDSHLWLAAKWFNNGGPDYRDMVDCSGRFIVLDGLHRTLAWVSSGLQSVLVFIAGNPDGVAK